MRNHGMFSHVHPFHRHYYVRRLHFYKILALLVSLSLTTYVIIISRLRLQEHYGATTPYVFNGKFLQGTVIAQPRCTLPELPLDNPEISKFLLHVDPIKCNASPEAEEDWVTVVNGSYAQVTPAAKARYKNIICKFAEIERQSDFTSKVLPDSTQGETYKFTDTDFVQVSCTAGSKRWKSFLAAPRANVNVPVPPKNSSKTPRAPFNVLMWGHDSLSRNMFMRKLPSSYKYLMEQLGGIVLKGYNIVGDGTPQALIPMLTGFTELELPETRRRKGGSASHVNVYPFIWNEYKEKGYLTGYMEDCPSIGTFTYRLKGFDKPPTDFYMRPYFVAAEPAYKEFPQYCIGSLPRHKVMMNYVRDILHYKEGLVPKFLLSFHSELSHDNVNAIQGADQDMVNFFKELNRTGALNNTVLIVMSDHGNRFASIRESQQGKQEERMPMFMFIFPPSFKSLYGRAFENFQKNSHILSTPFDIHATLQDLLNITSLSEEELSQPQSPKARSQSLFRPISLNRTCRDASIEPHWCACLQWQVLSTTLPSVQKAAGEFVQFLNTYLSNYTRLCEPLRLSKVTWAANLSPTEELLHFKKTADADGFLPDLTDTTRVSHSLIQLKVETLPGQGLFEVSLQHDLRLDSLIFNVRDISRINKYGRQAFCVESDLEHLRKFCYCRGSE